MKKKIFVILLMFIMVFSVSATVYASCDVCGHDGVVTRIVDENTEVCPFCQKLGYFDADCLVCHGDGKRVITALDVREDSFCRHFTCDKCGGDGIVNGYFYREYICSRCAYFGYIDDNCFLCHGDGYYTQTSYFNIDCDNCVNIGTKTVSSKFLMSSFDDFHEIVPLIIVVIIAFIGFYKAWKFFKSHTS